MGVEGFDDVTMIAVVDAAARRLEAARTADHTSSISGSRVRAPRRAWQDGACGQSSIAW